MRVLMVSDVYFPRVNGVSTSIETFRQALREQQVDVRLVVPQYANEASTPEIIRVPGRPVWGDPEDRLVGWRAMHQAVLAAARDCDVIHVQTPFVAHYAGLKAGRQLGLPVIATYHTLFEEYLQHYAPFLPQQWLRQQARRFSRRQCNDLDAVIVPSTAMQEKLTEYGVTTPIQVLPTGIPLASLRGGRGQVFRYQQGILSTRPVALFVGRVAHEKNIDFLLDALMTAKELRADLLLVIAGEGPALPALKEKVRRMGLGYHVHFVGYMDRKTELPDCYAAADVFVFASRTETQGLVLLEAMAAGVPVIALAEMGTRDILSPLRGAIVPPDNPVAFGKRLADFCNRPSAWQHLSREAPVYAAEWSDVAMAARLAQFYQHVQPAKQPSTETLAAELPSSL